jgi:release factor glutamine methyltransferase
VSATDPSLAADLVRRLRAAGCVFAEEEAALILEQAAAAGDAAGDAAGGAAGGSDRVAAEVDRLAAARERGLPLEQVLGWAELAGVRVTLEPGVFVPRRRTALMVTTAVSLAVVSERDPVMLLDLCCGSGAVAAAVRHGLAASGTRVEVVAADVDPVAVRCAGRNLPGARVLVSDLLDQLPDDLRGRVDVLTANVPYVPTDALALMPREAREHEPRLALDGGVDGLAVLRRVAQAAPDWLAPGGTLVVETSERQRPAALEAMRQAGLTGGVRTAEDLGAVVVLGAQPVVRRTDETHPRR